MARNRKSETPSGAAAVSADSTAAVDIAAPDPAAAPLEVDELRIPFDTTARLRSGLYALLSAELVLNEEGERCKECGSHSGIRIENFDMGKPGTRWLVEGNWDAANERHSEWLGAQRRRPKGGA